MEEVWKDAPGFEKGYMISNLGRVYSKYTHKIRKNHLVRDGYISAILKQDGKQYGVFIHRLVAQAFIPNPNNLPIVNHKDENPANNCVSNLEWCSYSYNNTYNDTHIKRNKKFEKPVYCYDKTGQLKAIYPSLTQGSLAVLGTNRGTGNITMCCKGQLYTYHKLVWSYVPLTEEEVKKRFILSTQTQRGKKNNILSKKVNQYDLDMNYITSYPSANEASRQTGIGSSLITSVCRRKAHQTHGFIFKYVE